MTTDSHLTPASDPFTSGANARTVVDRSAFPIVSLPAVASGESGSELTFADGTIRRTILPGGTRVITETIPGVFSATVGLWVPRGSRDENVGAMGATHFLEHLLFKGTESRSAKEIAQLFDQIGGHSNAATGKENTHYYATVLGEDLPLAIDCLMDMLRCARLDAEAFELERGVILEELAMDLDDGDERLHDAMAAHMFPGHPLGRPVGGMLETVREAQLEAIKFHYRAGYTPDQLVVAIAGNVNHDQVCEQVGRLLSQPGNPQWEGFSASTPARDFSRQIAEPLTRAGASMERGQFVEEGNFEQSYLLLGGPGISVRDSREVPMSVLRAILGGGMSSRLFQNIREERGLAYSTYAFSIGYRDVGQFGVGAVCNPDNADEVVALMRAEMEKIASEPVSEEELTRVKGQLRGSTLLAMERTSPRAMHLAQAEIERGEFVPLERKLERLRTVSAEEVLELAQELVGEAGLEIRVCPNAE